MNVWSFWEGPTWPYIDLCLATIRRQCVGATYHHLTPATLGEYLPDSIFSRPLSELPNAATRADAIRAALLARHGGFWCDADTIMLRSPNQLDTGHDLTYAVWDRPPRRVFNGYVYARRGSPVAAAWLEEVNRRIVNGQTKWTALGEGILTTLADQAPPMTTRQVRRETFAPIDVDFEVDKFFKPHCWKCRIIEGLSVTYALNHSWMTHHHRAAMTMPLDEMAQSPLLIHKLLTWARENLI